MESNGASERALRSRAFAIAFLSTLLGVALLPVVQAGPDYIPEAPPTVYEDPAMSPQTMDYDKANKTFIAHPGWIRDKLIHYYKFRMYTPDTYPETVKPGVAASIPIGEVYLLTTTGDFSGVVMDQKPIMRWHTADGENYSDFVQVMWTTVSSPYIADTYRSYGDLVENGTTLTPSDIYANVPVVPTGSRLQDPSGSGFAPIQPLMVWYRGVEVQTFVFETTSQAFADHLNPLTCTGTASEAGSGFEITVEDFVSAGRVSIIPIWHLNQYWSGVQPGVNHGGPWRGGQRNIIDSDRGDPGYSPLWQVFWASKVPVDYSADAASSASQLSETNGFEVLATPMYVNCPNVGPVGGGEVNPNKEATFGKSTVAAGESVRISGALVMSRGAVSPHGRSNSPSAAAHASLGWDGSTLDSPTSRGEFDAWANTRLQIGMNPIARGPGFGCADRLARSSDLRPSQDLEGQDLEGRRIGYFFEYPLCLLYVRWSQR